LISLQKSFKIFLTKARPIPSQNLLFLCRLQSICPNFSKIFSRFSAGIQAQLSIISNKIFSSTGLTFIIIFPQFSVNFRAFETRFIKTCLSLSES
jgi:hypothetical protein